MAAEAALPIVAPELIPLQRAVLCLDCEQISNSATTCVGCGSSALLNLARVLDPRERQVSEYAEAR